MTEQLEQAKRIVVAHALSRGCWKRLARCVTLRGAVTEQLEQAERIVVAHALSRGG